MRCWYCFVKQETDGTEDYLEEPHMPRVDVLIARVFASRLCGKSCAESDCGSRQESLFHSVQVVICSIATVVAYGMAGKYAVREFEISIDSALAAQSQHEPPPM